MNNSLNLNCVVKVKLTITAIKILESYHKKYFPDVPFTLPECDTDGFSDFQLWILMKYFGPSMYLGGPTLFADNSIHFTTK